MKFPNSLIQSMTVSQRARLRTPLCLAALAAMLFAGTAWGQMTTGLISRNLVPVDSTTLYPESNFTVNQAFFGDASGLDAGEDGVIDATAVDVDGSDPGTVGVVDWVIVELRFVSNGGNEPSNLGPTAQETTAVSKTALLLSDGSVVDADDPTGGVLTFEDLEPEFDDRTHEFYVVVDHRNHLPVMSEVALVPNGDGDYEYDFGDAQDKAFGNGMILHAVTGLYALYRGDINGDGTIGFDDGPLARSQAVTSGYFTGDVNFDGSAGFDDEPAAILQAIISSPILR